MAINGVKAELLKEKLKSGDKKSGMPTEKELTLFGDKATKTSANRATDPALVSALSTMKTPVLPGGSSGCIFTQGNSTFNQNQAYMNTLFNYTNLRNAENARLWAVKDYCASGSCCDSGNNFWAQLLNGLLNGAAQAFSSNFQKSLSGASPANKSGSTGGAGGTSSTIGSGGATRTSSNSSVSSSSSSSKRQVDSDYKGEKAVEDAVNAQNTAIDGENKYLAEANQHGETLKTAKAKKSDLETRINALNDEREDYLEKYMKAKMDYEKNKAEIRTQKQIVNDQNTIIGDCDKRIKEKSLERTGIERKISETLQPALNKLNAELKVLNGQIKSAKNDNEIASIREKIVNKELEIKRKEAEIKAEEAKIERLIQEIEAIKKTQTSAREKLNNASEKLKNAEYKQQPLKDAMEQADKRNKDTAAGILAFQKEIDTVTADIGKAESDQQIALSRADDQRQRRSEAEASETAAKREVDTKRKAQEDVNSKGFFGDIRDKVCGLW